MLIGRWWRWSACCYLTKCHYLPIAAAEYRCRCAQDIARRRVTNLMLPATPQQARRR